MQSTPTLTLSTGQKMPVLGLGTWKSEPGLVAAAVKTALTEVGYRHIDCAKIYGNEPEIGTAFHEVFSGGQITRQEIFVTSKLWNNAHNPDLVEATCRATLKDLQLDYLDLYLMHWGVAFQPGGQPEPVGADKRIITEPVSVQQTWQAMEALVDKGLVKAIGVANFTGPMLIDLLTYAKIKPAVNQIEVHPYNSQTQLLEYCRRQKIVVTAYSPLGSPGNAGQGHDLTLVKDPQISTIAQAHGKSPAQVLIKWAITRGTIVIPKSTNPVRIKENFDVFDFELTKDEVKSIDALDKKYRYVDPSKWWGIPYFD